MGPGLRRDDLSIEHSVLLPGGIAHGLLAEIATFWREFIKTAFVTYYPERHYMRGPGPACAAKRKSTRHD